MSEGGFIDLSARFEGSCADIPGLLAQDLLAEAERYCATANADFTLDEFTFTVIPRLDARLFALGWAYKDHQVETGRKLLYDHIQQASPIAGWT